MKNIITLLLFFTYLQSAKAQVCFNYATPSLYPGITWSACTADFNGDGNLDVAEVGFGGIGTIFLGTGNGSFSASTSFTTIVGWPNQIRPSIVSADFNGDSNSDLAITTDSLVEIFLGNGTGNFSLPSDTIGLNGTSIVTRDYNSDGDSDIIVTTSGSNSVTLLLGNGLGGFNNPVNFTTGNFPTKLISKDFNGDGFFDLASASKYTNEISILLGTGTGNFGSSTNYTITSNANSITDADFNGDGNTDLACIDGATISILYGNGAGTFSVSNTFSVNAYLNFTTDITAADYNSDGKSDLAYTEIFSVAILLGSGTGTFSPAYNYTVSGLAFNIINTDLNEDSKTDLIITRDNSSTIEVLLNCSTLSIFEITDENDLFISPNPTSSIINITDEHNKLQNTTIEIKNTLGQIVLSVPFSKQLNISELSSGIYFLKLQSKESKKTVKVIKE
jgi:hypothetical protein